MSLRRLGTTPVREGLANRGPLLAGLRIGAPRPGQGRGARDTSTPPGIPAADWEESPLAGKSRWSSPVNGSLLPAALAASIGFACVLLAGRWSIPRLRRLTLYAGHSASPTLNTLHAHKQTTPTMGGLFVLAGFLVAVAICADWRQPTVQVALGLAVCLGALGLVDDWLKARRARRGLLPRQKLAGQLLIALAAALWLRTTSDGLLTALPGQSWSSGAALFLLVLWIVASSNAVNVTDGLDGLATGCLLWATASVGWMIYHGLAAGSHQGFPLDQRATNHLVLCGALVGCLGGFLVFNRRPARVFLGDTGSLPLGGLLGFLVLASGSPMAGTIACAVFVVELASVALQIGWFKSSGRRLLRCAPLHHHYQFAGWSESQIVRGFCAVAAVCAAVGGYLGWESNSAKVPAVAQARPDSPQPPGSLEPAERIEVMASSPETHAHHR